jgi:hypothetical protein
MVPGAVLDELLSLARQSPHEPDLACDYQDCRGGMRMDAVAFYETAREHVPALVLEHAKLLGRLATARAHAELAQRREAELTQAIGLATTAVPTMVMDPADPVGMMQKVVARMSQLETFAKRMVQEFPVTELFEEHQHGDTLREVASGEWVCSGCGARGDSEAVDHDAPCFHELAVAALEVRDA